MLVIFPEIVCPEVASAISRGTNEDTLAIEFVKEMKKIPNFTFVSVDSDLSDNASKLAAEYKMRGCDGIYVAVTQQFNLKLITLDDEQRIRS